MIKINDYLLFVITITFAVITLGAYVRLSHAGLGCPDWPGCYGYLIGVPDNSVEIANAQANFSGANVDITKAWKEMIHRYLAGTLGIFIFIISCIFYKKNTFVFLIEISCSSRGKLRCKLRHFHSFNCKPRVNPESYITLIICPVLRVESGLIKATVLEFLRLNILN